MSHYVCTGTCLGVSDTPKMCGDPSCTHFNKSLHPCECHSGDHRGMQAQQDEDMENEP